ncbi:MAG TPA: YHS domain-containing protein [Acidobacteriota bacterium]|nr:YHS domain-containing protein [Acidobacteriota bacterium]HQF87156.1 YHS domain-containing protein [Acidobacteriota bacterium]HQG91717.1 YHS domain-containing protein [Acidobacteriota bacterium]HQK87200.1 YHS domain-containing protein [Acidobacteriota bacterium]
MRPIRFTRAAGCALYLTGLVALMGGLDAESARPQTRCPVSNKAIGKHFHIDRDGYRIYFCSSACIDKFKKNPQQYLDTLKKQGVTLAKTPPPQSFCPPCGMKVDRTSKYVDVNGYRLYSCGDYCSKKMKDDPDKYIQMIRDKHQEPEPAPIPDKHAPDTPASNRK